MARRTAEQGFTLIELLVVIAMVGILAAIAIPQYNTYRSRTFNARVETDARNCATAEEAYFIDNDTYTSDATALGAFAKSDGTVVVIAAGGSGDIATSFAASVTHPNMSYTSGCTYTSDAAPSMSCG
jgi:prepilin-type N-terminal cleavage/methylation domain-containing protein